MLTRWTVEHFKSAYDSTALELGPLTVFAGANSAGKSTIIQSMLLTAQTLQSSVFGRPVVLNGHMARLGSFSDIVSDGKDQDSVSIGFDLELPPDISVVWSRPARLLRQFLRSDPDGPGLRKLNCTFSFSARGDDQERRLLGLQPRLEESSLRVHAQDEARRGVDEEVVIRRGHKSIESKLADHHLQADTRTQPEASALEFEVLKLAGRRPRYADRFPKSARNVGANFLHFLPSRLAIVYDAVEAEVEQFMKYLTEGGQAWRLIDIPDEEVELSESVRAIFLDAAKRLRTEMGGIEPSSERVRRRLDEFEQSVTLRSVHGLVRRVPAFGQLLNDRQAELRQALRAERPAANVLRYSPMPDWLAAGVETLQQFFTSGVKYLGPLRDEPKPVYPLAGATDPRDVGLRGEQTAAVLDINRSYRVKFIGSAEFLAERERPAVSQAPLLDAVRDWLGYMGVGTELRTGDLGKLGHELRVSTGPDSPALHDLTQVGVGISQVLPILVLSLLAEPGSTLIFEQPELHLHPRVQTRLADFFVGLTWVEKQCIVETHSEYLINRLRYRAAVGHEDEIAKKVMIYFVEKRGARSSYRRVSLTPDGRFMDWPKGFFDEGEANASGILRAAVRKRQRKA